MTARSICIDTLLGVAVLACWIGTLGMVRMPKPTQALHYLTLPATIGMIALLPALFLEAGFSPVFFKTILIAFILLAINSVVTHATARAFRTREIGHWEPRNGDPIELVPSSRHPKQESDR